MPRAAGTRRMQQRKSSSSKHQLQAPSTSATNTFLLSLESGCMRVGRWTADGDAPVHCNAQSTGEQAEQAKRECDTEPDPARTLE